jgi:hypothetical protein
MPLFAQIEKWHEMGREFQSDHSKLAPDLIVVCILVLVIVILFLWGLVRLMNRQEGRRSFNNPKQLFDSLARAHQLNRQDRRIFLQIARVHQVAQPSRLFLDPDQFDAALAQHELQGQETAIAKLRDRLFAN